MKKVDCACYGLIVERFGWCVRDSVVEKRYVVAIGSDRSALSGRHAFGMQTFVAQHIVDVWDIGSNHRQPDASPSGNVCERQ